MKAYRKKGILILIEALHYLLRSVTEHGMLSGLSNHGLSHRLSIFFDDVMIFLKPLDQDIGMCATILEDFKISV